MKTFSQIVSQVESNLLLRSLCLLAALAGISCKNEVTDTEGRTFVFDCKAEDCTLASKDASNDSSAPAFSLQSEGRVLLACPAESPGFDCRPLTCDTPAPCSALGGAPFTCEKSICQAPDRALLPADKLALCLAKTGAWKRSREQLERLTLARACTEDCVLPAVCRGI